MKGQDKTKGKLIDELKKYRNRIAELEEVQAKRYQAEERLRESEERLKAFMDSAPHSFSLYDSELKLVEINEVGLSWFPVGTRKKNLIGKHMLEIAPYIKETGRYDKYMEVIKADKPFFADDIVSHPRFGAKNLIVSAFKAGKGLGIVATDITERKRAEEEAKSEKDKLLALVDGLTYAGTGIDIIGLDYKILYQNQFLMKRYGNLTGKICYEKYMGLKKPCDFCPMKKAIKNESVEKAEVLAPDGRTYELISAPIPNPDGTIDKVIEVVLDITERKKAEEELRQSERKFRVAVENNPDFIVFVKRDGTIFDVNRLAKGYTREMVIGQSVFNENWYETKEQAKAARKQIDNVFRTVKQGSYEYSQTSPDGTLSFYETRVAPFEQDIEGRVISVQCATRDITEKKKAEKEKEKLQTQLIQSEKMAGIGTLTSGIAHEFNNLLQIMSGPTEFAQRTKKPEDMEEALDIVANTSDRVSKIIRDLLTLSRREVLEKEVCNITEHIEPVLSLTEEQLKKHNIRVVREYRKTPNVEVNKGEMQQVFLNMVTNARDAMLPKGGRLAIKVKKVEGNIEISFTDTGIGIEEENLGRVFEPFYTTKGAVGGDARTQGIGLGLSVSYGIVERHEGTIEVESEVGKGTTFTIRLPARAAKAKKKIVKEKSKVKATKKKPMNVLVVDDEEEICKMIAKWLSAEGHKVKSAITGKRALNLFKKEHFDIVFLDIVMPGMPAIDALAEIKEISSKTKVCMITGKLVDKDLWKELKEKGASGYIQKPFRIEDIKNCITKIRD